MDGSLRRPERARDARSSTCRLGYLATCDGGGAADQEVDRAIGKKNRRAWYVMRRVSFRRGRVMAGEIGLTKAQVAPGSETRREKA